jgi:hypothetical protein
MNLTKATGSDEPWSLFKYVTMLMIGQAGDTPIAETRLRRCWLDLTFEGYEALIHMIDLIMVQLSSQHYSPVLLL